MKRKLEREFIRGEVAMFVPKWTTEAAMRHFKNQMWYFTVNGLSTRVFLEKEKDRHTLQKAYNLAVKRRNKIRYRAEVPKPLFVTQSDAELETPRRRLQEYTNDKRTLENDKLIALFWFVGYGNVQARYLVNFTGNNPQNKARWIATTVSDFLGVQIWSVDTELQRGERIRR